MVATPSGTWLFMHTCFVCYRSCKLAVTHHVIRVHKFHHKVLCAVSYFVDHGHHVLFDQDDSTGVDTSRIVHKKMGRTIRMVRDRNVWTIDAYIGEGLEEGAGFGRQG